MKVLIRDRWFADKVRDERRALGHDKYDEVWDGVTIMSPLANNEHQDIANELAFVIRGLIDRAAGDFIAQGANVSDLADGWTTNHRVPDLVVYLSGTKAINHGTHFEGGPDFAVEIGSPDEEPRDKLGFYAAVKTRELLVIDRDPWRLELYQLSRDRLVSRGTSTVEVPTVLASGVFPLTLHLSAGEPRPTILVQHSDGREWRV